MMRFAFIFIVVSVIFLAGCSSVSMNFVGSECSKDLDIQNLPREAILNKSWVGDRLVVDCYVKTVCEGVDVLKGSYYLDGNNLILGYRIVNMKLISPCICKRNLRYEFSGLEKKDYSVRLEQQK